MDDKPMEIIFSVHDTICQKHEDDNCTAILMKVEWQVHLQKNDII